MSDFVWPSDRARAENDELNRVCGYLEEVLDEQEAARAQGDAEPVGFTWDAGRFGRQFTPYKDAADRLKLEGVAVSPVYTQPPSGVQPIAKALGEFMRQTPDEHWIVASAWKKGDYLSEVTVQHMGSEPKECANATPPRPEWVKCSERLPTEADADMYGKVWCFLPERQEPRVTQFGFKEVEFFYNRDRIVTHWMPTGLKRPNPPEKGGE